MTGKLGVAAVLAALISTQSAAQQPVYASFEPIDGSGFLLLSLDQSRIAPTPRAEAERQALRLSPAAPQPPTPGAVDLDALIDLDAIAEMFSFSLSEAETVGVDFDLIGFSYRRGF